MKRIMPVLLTAVFIAAALTVGLLTDPPAETGSYKIVFQGNGADKGKMNTVTVNCAANVQLTKNAFRKAGYHFATWNTQADGTGAKYKNEAIVSGLGKDGQTVTLYAQWKPASD